MAYTLEDAVAYGEKLVLADGKTRWIYYNRSVGHFVGDFPPGNAIKIGKFIKTIGLGWYDF
jgi:hypothetical protein